MNAIYKKIIIFTLLILSGSIIFIIGCTKENPSDTATKETQQYSENNTEVALPDVDFESQKVVFTASEIISKVENSQFLDGVHHKHNVDCESCHSKIIDNAPAEIPSDELCLSCHGGNYEVLVEKLAVKEEWKDINPHNPAHDRESCITCHRSHQSFEFTCSACHTVRAPERFH
ncbi:cytochrome c3 family protein [Desulfosporosinus shakirovi]|uniref:cytochrome c3 family protein n=1 Tax=Desulfosporosinus shakirovi TaxID=2885154 RepID=UPI001E2DA0A8|nr:cytochrome c3 family protein [Desulfosporosinus sp. SRJS8]MCB8814941.1 cytochrome c3 family protein [Desulfosporosinus sp. SRJS8]